MPPNETKDDSRAEGIELLANLSANEALMPSIMSYLTVFELLAYLPVCKGWNRFIKASWKRPNSSLSLNQFWGLLGTPNTSESILRMIQQWDHVTRISLDYCTHVNDAYLQMILTPLVERRCPVRCLNLFYCGQLTDATAAFIATSFPDLLELNLGRCPELTDTAMRSLGRLKHLQKLNIVSNAKIGEETFMILDDTESFPALTLLDMQNTPSYLKRYVDELLLSRPSLRVLGPEQVKGPLPGHKPSKKSKSPEGQ